MKESDLRLIETKLSVALPEFYRSTMLNYPFPTDSYAAESYLMNDPEMMFRCLLSDDKYPGIGKPFFVGNDGGEEVYFIDIASDNSCVYVYNYELGKHQVKAKDWGAYLSQIKDELKEIDADVVSSQKTIVWGDRCLAIILGIVTIIGIIIFLYFGFK